MIDFDQNFGESERYYSYDTVEAEFDTSNGGITTDGDGGYTFDWNEQTTVTIDAQDIPQSYSSFFDTDSFTVIDATVARPIEQEYYINDEWYTFYKPESELRKAGWSIDSAPWTLEHPSNGTVRSTTDIRGFWKYGGYNDGLDAKLYFPSNDDEAKSFIEQYDNVSVGFLNSLVRSDRDGVDADQVNMYFDHVASVRKGRCSDDDGCGLDAFTPDSTDQNHVQAGSISVSDVQDNLITADTTDSEDIQNDTMTCDCNGGQTDGEQFMINVDDLSLRKVRSENDAVDSEINELESEIESLEDTVDSLDSHSDLFESLSETIVGDSTDVDGQTLIEEATALQDALTDAQDSLDEYRGDERDELLSDVKNLTDSDNMEKFEQREDETVVDHIGRLEDTLETMEMVKGDTSPTTVTPQGGPTVDSDGTSGSTRSSETSEFSSRRGDTVDTSQFADVTF